MVTRADLKARREAGATPADISENRRILYERALVAAAAALADTATAIAAVEGTADLAEAQAAVSGLDATVSGARDEVDTCLP